jgi:signal transduction histidine kinase/putative methionine-R-sulfoxide reductase with GAF domain/ActR/RegA family two-component response regulator
MRVADTSKEPAYYEVDPDTRSELCVPLQAGERIIGVINTESSHLDAFSQTDERLLSILGDQIAVAIERLRVEAAAVQRVQELQAITRISREITSLLDRQQVLESIVRYAAEISDSKASGLFMYGPEGQLRLVAAHGVKQGFIRLINDQGVPLQGTAIGQAITTRRPFQIPDIHEDPSYATPTTAAIENIRSILALPLLRGDETIGGIVLWHQEPRFFTREDERFMQALANQSVNAIENARLFEETHRRAVQQEALNEIIAAAVAAPDLPYLLETVLDLTLRAFSLDVGGLWILEHKAVRGLPVDIGAGSAYSAFNAQIQDFSNFSVNDWDQIEATDPLAAWAAPMAEHKLRATLLVPVMAASRRIGALALACMTPKDWSAEEISLAEAIGQQIGGAVERLDLLAKTREQAYQVKQIIDTVPEGVILLDADRSVVLANPAARHYLVDLLDDMDGRISHLGDELIEAILEDAPEKLSRELHTQGTPRRTFEVAACPLEANAQSGGWVLVLRDVTVERENQARSQMQERLATVGQLAAGIAHDFNNIMAAVVVYTDLLAMEPNLAPSSREQIKIIQQQIQRATSLIRQILDFSRRAVMEQTPLDLLPFIKELEKLLLRVLPEDIRLELAYQPGSYIVKADPARLQQALMNLILNARDAMPSGGFLRLHLEQINLLSEDGLPSPDLSPGEWLRLVIEDSGSGIPEDVLPHIFDPFFTTKPVGQGTGLGLAQAYGIIKQHKGSINVQSEVGEGAIFTIYLPIHKTPLQEAPEVKAHIQMAGTGETILIVEDDQAAREALISLLESQNYRVLSAQNGIQALEIFESERDAVALVVSDVVMPEMGGMALYQALKDKQPLTKILFITGHPLDVKDTGLLEEGRVHWLQKPFSIQEFSSTLRLMLEVDYEAPEQEAA